MRHLSIQQVSALLAATRSDRDRLLLTLCYEHGLRVSEAIALTGASVKNGYIETHPGKNGKPTVQKLQPRTLELWNMVTAPLHPEGKLFDFTRQWASSIFHTAAKQAGMLLPRKTGIHSLRHSIAHHLLDSGVSLPIIQRRLGHQNIASTGMYLVADDSQVDEVCLKLLA